jgi:hypothetical protein
MDRRTEIAVQTLQTLIRRGVRGRPHQLATAAVNMTDALLAELAKPAASPPADTEITDELPKVFALRHGK